MSKIDIQQVKQRFEIIGNSPLLDRAIEIAVQVASTDMSVLIMGESGVGKEVFPRIIHQYSKRRHNVYIAVNCGAIPEGTIDSELFGHIKGAFTGAVGDRKGYFEEADGGTIFLDEVGELPLATQARLLRVLETGEFIPVGASKSLKANVRIVAATNVNLKEAVGKGKFREDLLFRLNTVPIAIPPLRERASDIPLLFRYFALQSAEKYNMPPIRLDDDAKKTIEQYRWPGNIRELRNLTDRISILEKNRILSAECLESYLPKDENTKSIHPIKIDKIDSDKTFANEREIMYKLLFDMRKDLTEMKLLIANILNGKIKIPEKPEDFKEVLDKSTPQLPVGQTALHDFMDIEYPIIPVQTNIQSTSSVVPTRGIGHTHIEDESSYEEQPLSLEEVERNVIAASMRRNKGVRRAVAKELKIAERTLYRKLKEYGLEKEQ